jgi:protein TonB
MSSTVRYSTQAIAARPGKFTGVAIALLLHVIAVVALLQYAQVRSALTNAVPLMVSIVTPPPVEKPTVLPKPLPVKPRVQQVKPVEPPPILTAAPEAPAPQIAPPPPPPAPPQPVPVEVVAPVVSVPAAPAARVTPPSFSADYLRNPPPAYPAAARRRGEQGKVILRVLVNAAGGADQVEIRKGTGHSTLDAAALDAVRQWKFVPARQGDQPVAAWVLVPITFTLES